MKLGRLCQIIFKSDKEISGYGKLAQHAIFAYQMVWQTPLIALPPLRFPVPNQLHTNETSLKDSLSERIQVDLLVSPECGQLLVMFVCSSLCCLFCHVCVFL